MTGSDQVWGPVMDGTYDSAYCLSFTVDNDRRIAFAASFGRTKFTQETEEFYKKWLSRYESIAVREDSAVQLLNSWGLQAKQVIDPTLMLDSTYWGKFTTDIKKKYILVYQIHNDKKLDRYAKAVAKKYKLPLIRISPSFHQIVRGGKFKFCPDISVFLSYVKNAQCLITDSFQGTAFALNFNTPFVEVLIDPYGDVMPCNGTKDKEVIGNLNTQTWDELWNSEQAEEVRKKVRHCDRNCWMIGSVSPAMHKYIWKPLWWVFVHKFLRFFKKKKYSMYELKVVRDYRDGKVTKEELDKLSTCDMNALINDGLSAASKEQLATKTGEEIVDADIKQQTEAKQ